MKRQILAESRPAEDRRLVRPSESTLEPFVLTLGAVLAAAGLDPHDVLAIRHTYKKSGLP